MKCSASLFITGYTVLWSVLVSQRVVKVQRTVVLNCPEYLSTEQPVFLFTVLVQNQSEATLAFSDLPCIGVYNLEE